jgi:glucosamine--fructose-6-phosphate aminotransferase (isomerizing)
MCGIVGYTGSREATPIILEGLKKLEYRGYDSAGICTIPAGKAEIRRSQGKLFRLEELLSAQPRP